MFFVRLCKKITGQGNDSIKLCGIIDAFGDLVYLQLQSLRHKTVQAK